MRMGECTHDCNRVQPVEPMDGLRTSKVVSVKFWGTVADSFTAWRPKRDRALSQLIM